MRAPEITYRYLYPIDSAGPTFEMVSRQEDGSASALNVDIRLQGVPKNKILVLQNVTLEATPGATQSVDELDIAGFTTAGANFRILHRTTPGVADDTVSANWQGEVYCMGRGDGNTTLRMRAIYSAAVNANALTASFNGIIIPRGNAAAF